MSVYFFSISEYFLKINSHNFVCSFWISFLQPSCHCKCLIACYTQTFSFSCGSSNCNFLNFVFIINFTLLFKMFHCNSLIINFYLELIIHLNGHIIVHFNSVKDLFFVFIFFHQVPIFPILSLWLYLSSQHQCLLCNFPPHLSRGTMMDLFTCF